MRTQDGSMTAISSHYNESCHSLDGAYAETKYNYTDLIYEREDLSFINVLEIGFGIGLTLEVLLRDHSTKKILFESLEIDRELACWSLKRLQKKFPQLTICLQELSFSQGNISGRIIVGDAVKTIKELKGFYHLIFQDAFSPAKNPELWTLEWFKDLTLRCREGSYLSTYCSAAQVQKNLKALRWKVKKVPGYAHKRESIRAQFLTK